MFCNMTKFKPELFSVINTGTGLVVAVLITHYVLPYFGGYQPHWGQDAVVTLIYTAASLVRNDIVYRLFHRFFR